MKYLLIMTLLVMLGGTAFAYDPTEANGISFAYLKYEKKVKNKPVITEKEQKNRPGFIKGILLIGDQIFNFGTGSTKTANRSMKRGSIPYGVHEIEPGLYADSGKRKFRNNSFYIKDSYDPKWKTERVGILIHKASSKSLRTAGCIGIDPKQWDKFKKVLLKYQKEVDKHLVIRVDPDGTAVIAPKATVEAASVKPKEIIESTYLGGLKTAI
jgi:hypothetical protein